jgi:hypothetical protein
VEGAEVGVALDTLQGVKPDMKHVIAYFGSKDEWAALPKVASRNVQPDSATFPKASAQRFRDREVSFVADLNDDLLIVRPDTLPTGKAKLCQIFAVEITFENRARDQFGSHDYLLAQSRSAL